MGSHFFWGLFKYGRFFSKYVYLCYIKINYMIISKDTMMVNPNFLGFDENHDGIWDNYFRCPNKKCDGYNYLTLYMNRCPICNIKLDWI